jgi:type IV pilus assembly protein PilQ
MLKVKIFLVFVSVALMSAVMHTSLSAQSKAVAVPRIKKAQPVSSGSSSATFKRIKANSLNKIVNIRVKNAPLRSFLDSLAAQTGASFIAEEELEKKRVTAFMQGVTARNALLVLLRVKNLTYQQMGDSNVFVILSRTDKGPALVTKIYTLKYISLLPVMSVESDMKAITAQDMGGSTMAAGVEDSSSGSTGRGRGLVEGVRGAGEKGYEGGIAILNVIRSILSANGKIAVEPRTNSVVITDIAERFPQIEQILGELDRKAPQVLIEAEIVEINSDYAKELGLKWGDLNGSFASFQGPIREHTYFLRQGFFNTPSYKNFFNTGDAFDTPGLLSLQQFQILLSALISEGEAKYLGKPKVVTLNNKTAIITSSRDAALSVSATTTELSSDETVERYSVGLTLRVTPQVNVDGFITLLVQPSYSDTVLSTVQTSGGGLVFDPISRGVSTQVRVKNGETVVIGGLISSTENKTVRKVPLLGYIPIVGWLFTHVSNTTKSTDLVIMIKPTVVND